MADVLKSIAFGAVLAGLGSAAGWWLHAARDVRTREPSPAATARVKAPTVNAEVRDRVIVQAVDTQGIREAVRSAVGEELAALRSAEEAELDPAPAPETIAVIDSGHLYIGEAIASGRWGADEVSRVRDLGAGLSGEQYQELIRPLVIAINEGRVRVEVDGPPF